MSDNAEEETYSVIFSSLKHPVRRKIFRLLVDGSRTFTEILDEVGVDSSHLSYHLESLKELIKKEDGKYALSDFGRAATSLMLKVEEPEKRRPTLKRSLNRIYPKPLFIIMAALLVVSIVASIQMQSLNNQVAATSGETRYHFASQVSSSLRGLSAMYTSAGWGPPLTFWTLRDEYSNISIADISVTHIFSQSDLGHLSLLQLMRLDPNNQEYYDSIDTLFLSLMNFSDAMNRFFSDNKTSIALILIARLYDTTRDRPGAISEYFLNSYVDLNRVATYGLEQASESATALSGAVKIVLDEVYGEYPWLLTSARALCTKSVSF